MRKVLESYRDDNGDLIEVREYNDGSKIWYKNGKLHRDNDFPAAEYNNGYKFWYKEGKRHRVLGPANEYPDGRKWWFYEGQRIEVDNQKDFERMINLILFW